MLLPRDFGASTRGGRHRCGLKPRQSRRIGHGVTSCGDPTRDQIPPAAIAARHPDPRTLDPPEVGPTSATPGGGQTQPSWRKGPTLKPRTATIPNDIRPSPGATKLLRLLDESEALSQTVNRAWDWPGLHLAQPLDVAPR